MRKKIILAIIILILAVSVGYYIWHDVTVRHRVSNITNTSTSATLIPTLRVGEMGMPDLDRPINITVDMTEEAKQIARSKIEELSASLKENPDLFNDWLDLGIYRQNIGDYEAAREIWEYAGKIRPQNSTSFQNLGFLYAYYLKDNKKAEENYLQALDNGPELVYIYRNVYEFYRFVMHDDIKARAILEKGIKLNPDTSQDLKYLLNNF